MAMYASSEETHIWSYLMNHIKNPYGVAGLMGNLFAESSLNPICSTGNLKKTGFNTISEYVAAIDNGSYSLDKFANDGIAFGLAQWLYQTRKEALYKFAKYHSKNIGDLEMQLGYLVNELPNYSTVWNTLKSAKNVKEASDIVLLKYEKPANTSDTVKNKRENYGIGYFVKYWEGDSMKGKTVLTTIEKVNVRSGNGKQYGIISQIANKGSRYPWVATAENGWHAITLVKSVGWVSGDFTKVVEE